MSTETNQAEIPTLEATIEKIRVQAESKQASDAADAAEVAAMPDPEPAPANGVPAVSEVATPSAPAEKPVSAALRRLLEKEAALIEREKALAARETAPAPASKEPTLAELRRLYQKNKIAAMQAIDPNFKAGTTAKEFWYHDLGDLAPKEARAELQASSAMGGVEALRQEMEEQNQKVLQQIEQYKAEQAYQQYVGATQAYVNAVPDTLPLVKKFTAKKPDKVVQALIGVARKHAQATNGQVLTPEQAASKLEASLKELQFHDPVPTPSPAPQPVATPNTLRNKHTVVQPNRNEQNTLDDDALRNQAFKALEAMKRKAAANSG